MKKRAPIIVLVVLAVAAGITWSNRDAAPDGDGLFASGTVEATDADLAFTVPGRVDAVYVREGEHVEPGTRLARLDARELEAGVAAARAAVEAAESRLSELREGARPQELAQARTALGATEDRLAEAERDLERARTLFDGGAISRQALQRAETAVQLASAERDQATQRLGLLEEGTRAQTIAAQEGAVAQARAQLTLAEATAAHAVIEAPMAGVVSVRHREPGESVAPGTPVITLLDTDDRWVRIYVREDAIGRVRIGGAARIRSDTWPERVYDGEVVFIASEAEFTPRNVQTTDERTRLVYAVKVRITGDAEMELKPGVPADVTLVEG